MTLSKWSLAAAALIAVGGALALTAWKPVEADSHMEAGAAVVPEGVTEAPAEAPAMEEDHSEAPMMVMEEPATPYFLGEVVMGDENAPLTVIEYASLSCGHCAAFHTETFGEFKARYIDTGKVRFVYRDFPFNQAALVGAMVARCGGRDNFEAFIDVLMKQQQTWLSADNPLVALQRLAQFGGVSAEDFEVCVASDELANDIINRAMIGQEEHGVNSTPTFVIGGQSYSGNRSIDDLAGIIDPLL